MYLDKLLLNYLFPKLSNKGFLNLLIITHILINAAIRWNTYIQLLIYTFINESVTDILPQKLTTFG